MLSHGRYSSKNEMDSTIFIVNCFIIIESKLNYGIRKNADIMKVISRDIYI